MNTIKKEIEIKAPVESIINIMLNFQQYPAFVPNINQVELLSFDEAAQSLTARFHSSAPVLSQKIISTQQISYCLETLTIEFRQTDGLLKEFTGLRRLIKNDSSVTFQSEVRFHTGSSLVARMARPILEKVIKDNVATLLTSVKAEAERNSQRNYYSLDELKQNSGQIFSKQMAALQG